jgi:glycosyltransferase involved in cell wall biosynthesis
MSTVLLIAPYFPPMSVVGAKRPLTLVRHLPQFGWQPVVLTADPARESVDPSLAASIPAGLSVVREYGQPVGQRSMSHTPAQREQVRRVFGYDTAYFTPFDRYLWSTQSGIRAALRMIAEHRPSAIHICADPWSPLLAGLSLKRRTGLPLIVDFRDPWSLQRAKMALRPPPIRWAVRKIEARVFQAASKVVLNSEDCRDAYIEAYRGRLPAERFTAIRNAFDLTLFEQRPVVHSSAFTVLHFGHFRRLVPGEPLIRGFARFVAREGLSPSQARLRLAGTVRLEDESLIRSLSLDEFVDVLPLVPYREGLALLQSADVLALVTVGGMALTVPAKLYDYLAAQRPILAITDQSEPGRIVSGAGAGLVAPPSDPDAIAAALAQLRIRTAAPDRGEVPAAAVAQFSAEAQAKQFAAVLTEVTR